MPVLDDAENAEGRNKPKIAELKQPVERVEVELDYESYAVLHRVREELDEEFEENVCVDDVVNAIVLEHADSALTIDLVASYVGEKEEERCVT